LLIQYMGGLRSRVGTARTARAAEILGRLLPRYARIRGSFFSSRTAVGMREALQKQKPFPGVGKGSRPSTLASSRRAKISDRSDSPLVQVFGTAHRERPTASATSSKPLIRECLVYPSTSVSRRRRAVACVSRGSLTYRGPVPYAI